MGKGMNYNPVRGNRSNRSSSFGGSISSCRCCQDTLAGPKVKSLWKQN